VRGVEPCECQSERGSLSGDYLSCTDRAARLSAKAGNFSSIRFAGRKGRRMSWQSLFRGFFYNWGLCGSTFNMLIPLIIRYIYIARRLCHMKMIGCGFCPQSVLPLLRRELDATPTTKKNCHRRCCCFFCPQKEAYPYHSNPTGSSIITRHQ